VNTKPVFQADQNDFYLYETVANELPLSPGDFNIPYRAYEDAPPVAPPGMVARRQADGLGWVVVEDHRKDALYVIATGMPYTIGERVVLEEQELVYDGGGPIPSEWLTDVKPALPETEQIVA